MPDMICLLVTLNQLLSPIILAFDRFGFLFRIRRAARQRKDKQADQKTQTDTYFLHYTSSSMWERHTATPPFFI
jgi:hypothetical protein